MQRFLLRSPETSPEAMTPLQSLFLSGSLAFLRPQSRCFQLFRWIKVFKCVNNSREECIDLPLRAAFVEIDSNNQSHPERVSRTEERLLDDVSARWSNRWVRIIHQSDPGDVRWWFCAVGQLKGCNATCLRVHPLTIVTSGTVGTKSFMFATFCPANVSDLK